MCLCIKIIFPIYPPMWVAQCTYGMNYTCQILLEIMEKNDMFSFYRMYVFWIAMGCSMYVINSLIKDLSGTVVP